MFATVTLELLKGFVETLKIFLLTIGFSVPLGVVICMGSMHRFAPLRVLVRGLVWVVRGTPLMLQLILIFYGPGLLCEVQGFDRFTAVIVAFSLNYACYFSELDRGGYTSIPVGQFEAGRVLGMSRTQIFFRVILVQVVKNVLAPMGNEFITLVKDTALSRTIAIYEVTYMGQSFIKKGLLWPLLFTGVFYLLFSGVLTVLFSKLEKKLSYIRS